MRFFSLTIFVNYMFSSVLNMTEATGQGVYEYVLR